MAEFKNVDDFLNYRSSEGGGGARRFKSWKKDPGHLNLWLHKRQMPCAVWYHRVPELVVRNKKDSGDVLKNIWGRQHMCWEDESILKKQRFRDPETGRREHPPTKCILCRLQEAIREMIVDGKLEDTDVIFRFEGSDEASENVALHAGGFCSVWPREVDDETKERLSKHKIYMNKVYMESAVAKLNYVLTGVNHDDVQGGVNVAVETQLIGDKIKKRIRDEISSKDDEGNPFLNPYCIRLISRPEEKKFDDKYDALRIDRIKISSEIERLINADPPNISKFKTPFNQKTMRSLLEKHAVGQGKTLPWDEICNVPQMVPDEEEQQREPAPAASSSAAKPKSPEKPAAAAPPKEPPGDPCDDCGAPMTATQSKCGKCGAVYEVDAKDAGSKPLPARLPDPADPADDAVYDDGEIPF